MPIGNWRRYKLDVNYTFEKFMVADDKSVVYLAREKSNADYRIAFEMAIGNGWLLSQGYVEQDEKKNTALIKLVDFVNLEDELTTTAEANRLRMVLNDLKISQALTASYNNKRSRDYQMKYLHLLITATNTFQINKDTLQRDLMLENKFAIVYPVYDLNAAEYCVFMHENKFDIDTKRRNARSIIQQMLNALDYLHDQGYIYGNLTLSSIVITQHAAGPHAQITDFARTFKIEDVEEKFRDPTFQVYMPQETRAYEVFMRGYALQNIQIRGVAPPPKDVVDRLKHIKPTTAVDIWSCGVVATQLLLYAELKADQKIDLKKPNSFLASTSVRVINNFTFAEVIRTYLFVGRLDQNEWADAYKFISPDLAGIHSAKVRIVTDENAHVMLFGMDKSFNDATHLAFIKLIREMLRYNPANRITAKKALKDYKFLTEIDLQAMRNQKRVVNTDEFKPPLFGKITPPYIKKESSSKTVAESTPKTPSGSSALDISPPSDNPPVELQTALTAGFDIFGEDFSKNLLNISIDADQPTLLIAYNQQQNPFAITQAEQDPYDIFSAVKALGAASDNLPSSNDNMFTDQFFGDFSQDVINPSTPVPVPKPVQTIITMNKRPASPAPQISSKKANVVFESEDEAFENLLKADEEDFLSSKEKDEETPINLSE